MTNDGSSKILFFLEACSIRSGACRKSAPLESIASRKIRSTLREVRIGIDEDDRQRLGNRQENYLSTPRDVLLAYRPRSVSYRQEAAGKHSHTTSVNDVHAPHSREEDAVNKI